MQPSRVARPPIPRAVHSGSTISLHCKMKTVCHSSPSRSYGFKPGWPDLGRFFQARKLTSFGLMDGAHLSIRRALRSVNIIDARTTEPEAKTQSVPSGAEADEPQPPKPGQRWTRCFYTRQLRQQTMPLARLRYSNLPISGPILLVCREDPRPQSLHCDLNATQQAQIYLASAHRRVLQELHHASCSHGGFLRAWRI